MNSFSGVKKLGRWSVYALLMGATSILLTNSFSQRSAIAQETANPTSENCFATCGGEIPWPFQASNQAVELADEERYVLMGKIDIRGGFPVFVVDLEKHPWLATAKRKKDPAYDLVGSFAYWSQYWGRSIQLRAKARWVVNKTESGNYFTTVVLESLSDPAVETVRPQTAR